MKLGRIVRNFGAKATCASNATCWARFNRVGLRPIDSRSVFHLGTTNQRRLSGGRFAVTSARTQKGKRMSKSTFKGSLLATTIIAGVVLATPAYAQNQPAPAPTDAQGNTPPADAKPAQAAAH